MKPIYLELKAFGPYVETQSIDFEKLSEKGMFLIKGNTGSGKTTIFDAMIYALYGGSSGDSEKTKNGRNDLEEWRCTQAPADVTTYVSFVFEVHGRRYRFKRSLVPKRVNLSAKYEACEIDEDGNEIPFFENPKKEELNTKAEQLVGLTKDQFRQVVLLPQGQFERFLTATSEEKGKILEKIFNSSKWGRYASNFYNRALARKSALDEEKKYVMNSLSEEAVDSIEALSEIIDVSSRKKETINESHRAFDAEKKRQQLNEDMKLSERFKSLHRLEKDREMLVGAKAEIEEVRNRYNASEKAELLRNVLNEAETAEKEYIKRSKAADESRQKLPEAEAALKKAENDKHECEADSPVERLTKQIGEYELKRSVYENYDKLRLIYRAAEKELKEAEKHAEEASEKYTAAVREAKACKDDFDTANDLAERYRNKYFAGIYGEIAEELRTEPGRACPVCGSLEHPALAEKHPDSVSREEMEQAEKQARMIKKKWDDKEKLRVAAEEQKNTSSDNLSSKKTELERAKAAYQAAGDSLVEGIADAAALEQSIAGMQKQIAAYNDKCRILQQNLDTAREVLVTQKKNVENAETEKVSAAEIYKIKKLELDTGLSEKGYQSTEELKSALMSEDERRRLHERAVSYDTSCKDNEKALREKLEELKELAEPDAEGFEERQKEIDEETRNYTSENARLDSELQRLTKKIKELEKKEGHYKAEIQEAESDLAFAKKLRGDSGVGLQRYVLAIMFDQIIGEANRMLAHVHGGRYHLFRSDEKGEGNKRGLELKVHDNRCPEKEGRSVAMLSGGEKFLVSLALSIGMSTTARKSGVETEALFIDEGFGTLDDSSIHDAMEVLDSVRRSSGMIGIISHVQILEDNIPTHLEVIKSDSGSKIQAC